jgi:hypothetical protein
MLIARIDRSAGGWVDGHSAQAWTRSKPGWRRAAAAAAAAAAMEISRSGKGYNV